MTSHATHRPRTVPRRTSAAPPREGAGPSTSSSETGGMSEPDILPSEGLGAPQASADPVPALAEGLRKAVGGAVQDRPEISLLFSGGLDSTLLAHLLGGLLPSGAPGLELVTIGTEGSADLAQAERAASLLGLPWKGSTVPTESVRASAREVVERLRVGKGSPTVLTPLSLEVQTGLFLALQHAGRPTVLCGQGADELFLGYAHFRPLPGARLQLRYDEDLHRLLQDDLPVSERLARSLGLELRAPYLDPAWRALVEKVPLERRRKGGVPKALLREVAVHLGLPPSLAQVPKKALQYGSGVHAALSAR